MGTAAKPIAFSAGIGRILAALFACVGICATASAETLPTERVVLFLANMYAGVPMKSSEWLSRETRNSEKFKAFGGLNRMIEQSTRLAREYKGLRSVRIIDVANDGASLLIRSQVTFFDDERRKSSPAVAEREEVIWSIRVSKENGRWVLSL